MIKGFLQSLFKPKPGKMTEPQPTHEQPKQNEIWLTVAKSNIAHRFYNGGGINPHYRYSACGFETVQPKLRGYDGGRRCKRCERAGEF